MQYERGLAGAVRAEQRDPLAALHGEVDAEQRLPPVGVGEHQPLDLNRRTAHKLTTLAATAIATAAREIASPSVHCARVAPETLSSGIRPV